LFMFLAPVFIASSGLSKCSAMQWRDRSIDRSVFFNRRFSA
jgi:hypothetical protein